MWFENYIRGDKDLFISKLVEISDDLGIDPNWLMAVMMFESGLNPAAVNKMSGATGLIQFMPKTAQNLGTNTTELRTMSSVEQLTFVKKYFNPYSGKLNSLTDVYFAVFFPAAIGKSVDWVLQTSSLSSSKIAAQNSIFDTDDNDKITVGEVEDYFWSWIKKKMSIQQEQIQKEIFLLDWSHSLRWR